ncbi:hypothetical protein BD410DRAFT_839902 [Rickenella mellea]|uniref:Uncharacterized protein n=1 Tax=Rickenella mellea TaxID=50990 RepID=A0A4Y7Q353_9AGAM|nr:hypothetical protein BD410DRAFT_839902 [Rickenella mellea]
MHVASRRGTGARHSKHAQIRTTQPRLVSSTSLLPRNILCNVVDALTSRLASSSFKTYHLVTSPGVDERDDIVQRVQGLRDIFVDKVTLEKSWFVRLYVPPCFDGGRCNRASSTSPPPSAPTDISREGAICTSTPNPVASKSTTCVPLRADRVQAFSSNSTWKIRNRTPSSPAHNSSTIAQRWCAIRRSH